MINGFKNCKNISHGKKSCKKDQTFRLVFAQLRDANSVATILLVEPRANTSSAQSSTWNTLSRAQASSYKNDNKHYQYQYITRTWLIYIREKATSWMQASRKCLHLDACMNATHSKVKHS